MKKQNRKTVTRRNKVSQPVASAATTIGAHVKPQTDAAAIAAFKASAPVAPASAPASIFDAALQANKPAKQERKGTGNFVNIDQSRTNLQIDFRMVDGKPSLIMIADLTDQAYLENGTAAHYGDKLTLCGNTLGYAVQLKPRGAKETSPALTGVIRVNITSALREMLVKTLKK